MSLRIQDIVFIIFSHEPRHDIFLTSLKTWAKDLPEVQYALDYRPEGLDNVLYIPIIGRENISLKAKAMLEAIYEKYGDSKKWFVKVDGDSYLWTDRLLRFLSQYDPDEPWFFGHGKYEAELTYWPSGFVYILSQESLSRFHEGVKSYLYNHSMHEDAEVAKVLLYGNVSLTHVPQLSVFQRLDRVQKEGDLIATTSLSSIRMRAIHWSTRGRGPIPFTLFRALFKFYDFIVPKLKGFR